MFWDLFMIFRFPTFIKIPPPNNSLKLLGEANRFGPTRFCKNKLKISYTFLMSGSVNNSGFFLYFRNVEVWKVIFLKDVSITSLHFLKHFGDEYVVRGSRFGKHFGSSRNHPNSTGIHQESLIGNFGIIKAPKIK